MMHWKTLQTTIGAFALGVCLTTVVSPLNAADRYDETDSAAQTPHANTKRARIFKPCSKKNPTKIEFIAELVGSEPSSVFKTVFGSTYKITMSRQDALSILQHAFEHAEKKTNFTFTGIVEEILKISNIKLKSPEGTKSNTEIQNEIHDFANTKLIPERQKTETQNDIYNFIKIAFTIMGVEKNGKNTNPLGKKTKGEKKNLIDDLEKPQGNSKEELADRLQKTEKLEQLENSQMKALSNLFESQNKFQEKKLLIELMALQMVNTLDPYGDKTLDSLIEEMENQSPTFMFNFINPTALELSDYDKDHNHPNDEKKRVVKLIGRKVVKYCLVEKVSGLLDLLSDDFKSSIDGKLDAWKQQNSDSFTLSIQKAQKAELSFKEKNNELEQMEKQLKIDQENNIAEYKRLIKEIKKKFNKNQSEDSSSEESDSPKTDDKENGDHSEDTSPPSSLQLTSDNQNSMQKALEFYHKEAKGLGVWSGWLVAAFWDLVDKTPGKKVSYMTNASGMKIAQEHLGHLEQHMKDAKQDFKEIQKRIQYGNHTLGDLKNVYNALKKVSDTKKFPFSEKLQNRGLDFIVQELS